MICLTKREFLQAYRVLNELNKIREADKNCLYEDGKKDDLIYFIYAILFSPLIYIIYCLVFNWIVYGL